MRYDLYIANAEILDGTGQPPYRGDVAVVRDRIAAIFPASQPDQFATFAPASGRQHSAERLPAKRLPAQQTINAHGLTLMPGIVDPHSHADLLMPLGAAQQAKLFKGKLAQGITTTIIGNCGLGCAPLANEETETLLRAINAWMTPQSVKWPWRGIGEYLQQLADNGVALNLGTLIPHGPVRIGAMGLQKGAPTRKQLRQMRRAVEQGLLAGALGLSSGLIYPPGMYSAPPELHALAEIVALYDGIYTSHLRGSSETLLPAVKELLHVGATTGVRVHHSHAEAVGRAHWHKIGPMLRLHEQAARAGVRVSFDMFPYTAAATMMIALYPPWALEGGVPALLERLRHAPTRQRIARDIEHQTPRWPPWRAKGWPHNLAKATSWAAITIGAVASRRNKQLEGKTLLELGKLTGKSPFDAISDLLMEENGRVSMLIFEISGAPDERRWLRQLVTEARGAFCTDAEDYGRGLPHPAAYGAFPRILAEFVRTEPALSWPEAVRKMTAYPAQLFGLSDRGVIRVGAFADLVLFDAKRIRDRATLARPRQLATGIHSVWINGQCAFAEGEVNNAQAGVILKRS